MTSFLANSLRNCKSNPNPDYLMR